MNREAQSVVLLLVGGAVLRISLSDVYLRYVKEGLRPFLVVAGAILVLIAVATLWRELVRSRSADDGTEPHAHRHRAEPAETLALGSPSAQVHGLDPDDDGHGHSHGGPKVAWLLVLPVLAIFLIGPPALGSYAAGRAGTATVDETSEFAPLPSEDPVTMTVLDYTTRAIWDTHQAMKDRQLRLTGFLTPRPGGGFYLTRIMLSCCAADGRPLKVGLSGDVPSGLKADAWVEVSGTFDPKTELDKANDGKIPFLAVSAIKPIAQPVQPYEQ